MWTKTDVNVLHYIIPSPLYVCVYWREWRKVWIPQTLDKVLCLSSDL